MFGKQSVKIPVTVIGTWFFNKLSERFLSAIKHFEPLMPEILFVKSEYFEVELSAGVIISENPITLRFIGSYFDLRHFKQTYFSKFNI